MITRKRLSNALREMGFHPIKWQEGLWINNANKNHRVKVHRGKRSKALYISSTYSGTTWDANRQHSLKNIVLDEELLPLIFYMEKAFKNEKVNN